MNSSSPWATANPYASSIPPTSAKASIWHRDLRLGPAMSLKDKQQWYQLLGTLLGAGLGILDCMEVLSDQFKKARMKQLVIDLTEALEAGDSLSEGMQQFPHFFTPFEIQSIRMGETTGKLAHVLSQLETYYERRVQLRRKVRQTLSYPIAVVVIAILVLIFMLAFVVPMFQDIFSRFEAKLPPLTDAILALSVAFKSNGVGLALGLLGLIGLLYYVKNIPLVQRWLARRFMRFPVLGPLFVKLQLARMSYSLSLMLQAKVTLDQALTLAKSLTTFYPLRVALDRIRDQVIEGASLYEALQGHEVFPLFFRQIIKVGEKTAQLDQLLERLATQLDEESQAGVGQLTQFIEPVLIIVLGVMVATILVSMYLPMFELSRAVM